MYKLLCLLAALAPAGAFSQQTGKLYLDDLVISSFNEGLRPVSTKANYSGDTLRIGGIPFLRGLGGQSLMVLPLYLDKKAQRFTAMVGADDKGNKDIPVKFSVLADGKLLFESGDMRPGDAPQKVDIDLTGVSRLGLLVTDKTGGPANKRTYADWGDAALIMNGDLKPGLFPAEKDRYILTPAAPLTPRINAAALFGATPGNPFLFTIATTGKRPIRFSAENLPRGLSLDAQTGIITGSVATPGSYITTVKAKNALGEAVKKITIKIGDTIALTPPIGWNGWNSWADRIDRQKVLASAGAMVQTGLRDHGWTYINIDDAWQGKHDGSHHALQPNEKFPDIKDLFDRIHAMGLKAGLYSTPYIASYGGYPGSSSDSAGGGETHELIKTNRRAFNHIGQYRFEAADAKQMAEWGTDFLKYDWRVDVNSTQRMSEALKKSGRDIVFSLSNSAPFDHAADWVRLSNMWRTGPDIRDSWASLFQLAFTLDHWRPYGGRGHWNDPDMMILGNVSIGPEMHPTRLTPDEQYSHVSIYSLLAAPMLVGCPLEQLDDFTLGLLSNDEVIAIDQDTLGLPGTLIAEEKGVQVWAKQLADGSYAVGIFNTGDYKKTAASYFNWGDEKERSYSFDFAAAGLKGAWKLRDVWRQKDLGVFDGSFTTSIRHHGVIMVRMYPAVK